jgi:hypothetical protein
MRCDAMYSGKNLLMICRTILPPTSGYKRKTVLTFFLICFGSGPSWSYCLPLVHLQSLAMPIFLSLYLTVYPHALLINHGEERHIFLQNISTFLLHYTESDTKRQYWTQSLLSKPQNHTTIHQTRHTNTQWKHTLMHTWLVIFLKDWNGILQFEEDTFIKIFFAIFHTSVTLLSLLADTDKGPGAKTC